MAKDKKIVQESDKKENILYTPEPTKTYKVEVSRRSILFMFGLLAAVYVSYKLLPVILILFFAFVISSTLMPIVRGLINKGIPKALSVAVVYIISFFLVALMLIVIIVPFIQQLSHLVERAPIYTAQITSNITDTLVSMGFEINKEELEVVITDFYNEQLAGGLIFQVDSLSNAVSALSVLGAVIGGLILAFIISIYIVYDHDNFLDLILLQIVNDKKRNLVKKLIIDVEGKLGSWIVGQGAVSSIIVIMTWILLAILKVPFALPLSLLAGLSVTIPTFGPFIAAVPALGIALITDGLTSMLIVGVGYTVIQQVENAILVPKIMGNVVGVKPVVVMVGVLVSFTLGGIIGAIITVPCLVLLKIGYDFWFGYKRLDMVQS